MGILEKIADIESEIARTQKNKATEYHLGLLKAKLAKYRQELLELKTAGSGGGGPGTGFDVTKSGDGRVAMVGFPSVGKSTLLNALTGAGRSATAAYEFTTLTCVPGTLEVRGASVQLLDLPGIIEGAAGGRGRGRQVISTARTSDLVLIVLDAAKSLEQKRLLEAELETMGVRLNSSAPRITIKRRDRGGICMSSTVPLSHLNEQLITSILKEYRIISADVLFREDATVDRFIDAIEGGNIRYIPALYVYNKIDQVTMEEVDRLARLPRSVVISCEGVGGDGHPLGLDDLKEQIWRTLSLSRIYTRKRSDAPDFSDPVIVRPGATMEHVCHALHRDLATIFKYGLVWGVSAKHQPQRVGLQHVVEDEDVIQIIKRQ